jgi:signal transduction histidine kinase
MRAQFQRLDNVRAVVVTAAAVTLLVAGALAWLGWRLLSQERALEQQRRRDRLEQVADGLFTGLLRSLTETEAALAQVGSAPPWRMPAPPPGAVAVLLRRGGIETTPPAVLAYVPILPAAVDFDDLPFQQAERLEFHDRDYARAGAALRGLTTSRKPGVSSEALLRLGRVQVRSGQVGEALNTYGELSTNHTLSSAEVPYALLARFERCKLLAGLGRREALARESADLLASLESGQWPLLKDAYGYYSAETNRLIGRSPESSVPNSRLAVADAVESLWAAWQSGERTQLRPPARHVHGSGNRRTLVLINSTPERVAAFVYPDDAIRQLAAAAGWKSSPSDSIAASLVDENGQNLLGTSPGNATIEASRSLAAAQLPWRIRVATTGRDSSHTLFVGREKYLILGLAAIAALVALACYAMSRGVIRELKAAQLQTDFVSAVSHEFRSPLTTLLQLTELLAHDRIHDPNRRQLYFDILHKETGRLHGLVENLLDFGRMEAGRIQYRPESIDLYELVRDAVRDYQEEIVGSGYGFELTGTVGAPLRADREALRRVVRNLLENAVKYSPECRTVWIETGEESGSAVLRVRDRGMGIPPMEQVHIFDKFVRGSAAKQACIHGTGVGLAMVREIVRGHEGEVHLASEVGQGSTFTVRLPLSRAQ